METYNKRIRIEGAQWLPTFEPGNTVMFQNLKTDISLNGITGRVVEFDSNERSWRVRCMHNGEELLAKAENLKRIDANNVNEVLPYKKVAASLPLKPGDIVTFRHLTTFSLNGKTGRLVEFDSDSGSWRVRCKHDGKVLLAKAEHLKPKVIEVSDISDQERRSLSCPTHIYVLILDEHSHGWGRGYTEDGKVIGVYISKEAAVSASGDVDTSYGTFDEAIEPEEGTYAEEGCYIDNRNNPPDNGTLIQLGGKDIGEGDYVRLRILKKPLLLGLQGTF